MRWHDHCCGAWQELEGPGIQVVRILVREQDQVDVVELGWRYARLYFSANSTAPIEQDRIAEHAQIAIANERASVAGEAYRHLSWLGR